MTLSLSGHSTITATGVGDGDACRLQISEGTQLFSLAGEADAYGHSAHLYTQIAQAIPCFQPVTDNTRLPWSSRRLPREHCGRLGYQSAEGRLHHRPPI